MNWISHHDIQIKIAKSEAQSKARVFFDRHRNFEPRSSNEDTRELEFPSPNFYTTPIEKARRDFLRKALEKKQLHSQRLIMYAHLRKCTARKLYAVLFASIFPTTPKLLNGYVNKQNCRIWSEANPQVYVETPLHPETLTVWCALWAGGIIGPYFKNDEGHNVTVNGDRYRAMITNFFIPELNNHDVQELWFQQDGATCPTARATIDLLKDKFGDRLISGLGPVNWPPRSCDLTLFSVGLCKVIGLCG
ncbi:putative transposable element [Trichonephila clavipes]|nr:putative transposable element [Trichonephila clavipes]